MSSKELACLEGLAIRVHSARTNGRLQKMRKLVTLFRRLRFMFSLRERMRERVFYKQYHLDAANSFAWRGFKDMHVDEVKIRFLGFPCAVFEHLAAAVGKVMPSHVPGSNKRGGRPTRLDNRDVTAITLRHLTTLGHLHQIESDFGVAHSVASRAIVSGKQALRHVLDAEPAAAFRWPTTDEAIDAHAALEMRHYACPVGVGRARVALWADGTVTPIKKPGNDDVQRNYKSGAKGLHCLNHILVFDIRGRIVWFTACHPGSYNDARLIRPFLRQLDDYDNKNVGRACLSVDSGFTGIERPRTSAHVGIWRPLKDGEILPDDAALAERAEAMSAWTVSTRQHNEWSNGDLKKAFPRIIMPALLTAASLGALQEDIVLFFLLHNFRVNATGKGQAQAVYGQLMDERFQEQAQRYEEETGEALLLLHADTAQHEDE